MIIPFIAAQSAAMKGVIKYKSIRIDLHLAFARYKSIVIVNPAWLQMFTMNILNFNMFVNGHFPFHHF